MTGATVRCRCRLPRPACVLVQVPDRRSVRVKPGGVQPAGGHGVEAAALGLGRAPNAALRSTNTCSQLPPARRSCNAAVQSAGCIFLSAAGGAAVLALALCRHANGSRGHSRCRFCLQTDPKLGTAHELQVYRELLTNQKPRLHVLDRVLACLRAPRPTAGHAPTPSVADFEVRALRCSPTARGWWHC